jgi:hypothetical protein
MNTMFLKKLNKNVANLTMNDDAVLKSYDGDESSADIHLLRWKCNEIQQQV